MKGPFEISVEQEALFLLRVWHEGGKGDVWGSALHRVTPDDAVAGRPIPGINAVANEIQSAGSGGRAPATDRRPSRTRSVSTKKTRIGFRDQVFL